MVNAGLGYVRKKDFQITFDLGLRDRRVAAELSSAVRIVRTSRLHNTLLLEIAYPVDGLVHQTLDYLCINGVPSAVYDSLEPSRRAGDTTPGHITYAYQEGTVVDQYAVNSREELDGDDPMLDVLQIQFLRKSTSTRKWKPSEGPKLKLVHSSDTIVVRPVFGQVSQRHPRGVNL